MWADGSLALFYLKRLCMACLLRASGTDFDVDAFVRMHRWLRLDEGIEQRF
jgi:hypothetical protein